MAPRVEFFDGAATLIRPLVYVTNRQLAEQAVKAGYAAPPVCPQSLTSTRAETKELLRQFGRDQDQIRANLWRAARQAMGFQTASASPSVGEPSHQSLECRRCCRHGGVRRRATRCPSLVRYACARASSFWVACGILIRRHDNTPLEDAEWIASSVSLT
ncbi:MAG: hypothetical protein E3J64_06520 [Anaerolineales bacterium]|nr:MAG: hypothetical protein E3J64_06520 [Anaerolineales bacterium]